MEIEANFPQIPQTISKIKHQLNYEFQDTTLADYDLLPPLNYNSLKLTQQESNAIGSLIGVGIGDSLGSLLDNFELDYNRFIVKGFDDFDRSQVKLRQPLGLFTDDTSLTLCLSDSILLFANGIKDNQQQFLQDFMHRMVL